MATESLSVATENTKSTENHDDQNLVISVFSVASASVPFVALSDIDAKTH